MKGFAKGLLTSLCVFALLCGIALYLLGGMGKKSDSAQTQLVKDAVHSALMTCYAVEGGYPTDIAYLREHYGLTYDEDAFIVSYDAFASNILPEVYVTEVGAGIQ